MAKPDECAKQVLNVIPSVMQALRREMRKGRRPELSIPQFRTLAFAYCQPGGSLSQAAEHVGFTLPAMSKLVDGLVVRGILNRQTCKDDRRRLGLTLTPAGRSLLMAARKAAQAKLTKMLSGLSAQDCKVVIEAMQVLRGVFGDSPIMVEGSPGKRQVARGKRKTI